MAKPKATTLQQRFGFLDDDLKTPKHDEIIMWVDANMEAILTEIINPNSEWEIGKELQAEIDATPIAVNEFLTNYAKQTKETSGMNYYRPSYLEDYANKYTQLSAWNGLGNMPPKPNLRAIKKRWEQPIVSREYTVGFVDIYATYEMPCLSVKGIEPTGPGYSHFALKSDKSLPEWYIHWTDKAVAFEIKTNIPSLGELIRQIRMYQTYLSAKFVVVSPDDRFADPIESQGIGFYKYEPGKLFF